MSGSKYIPFRPIPGQQGVADAENNPGGRTDAITWKDLDGNIWLFGGNGYTTTSLGLLNDLWKYSPSTNEWVWIKGNLEVNEAGNYGTINVPDAANIPSARRGSISWMDDDGDLYLFGGYGIANDGTGLLNDLWKYETSSNEWTWMGGTASRDVPGIYGTQGSSNFTNWPGARGAATAWRRGNYIWIYGGDGIGATPGRGSLGDLWSFHIVNHQWSWKNGPTTVNVGANSLHPGTRSTGNNSGYVYGPYLYVFGGNSQLSTFTTSPHSYPQSTLLNDIWRYNVLAGTWSQVRAGSGEDPVYGTMGVPDILNQPGKRAFGTTWTGSDGNFWLSGGIGYNSTFHTTLNDIWRFDPATETWTWMKGENAGEAFYGNYGTQGTGTIDNIREARMHSNGWTDAAGRLWSFGGNLWTGLPESYHNDLWMYDPSTNVATWVKGDDSKKIEPVYGGQNIAAPQNTPGERRSGVSWYDNDGNLWMFGGEIMKNQNGPPVSCIGDLWKYDISEGSWVWVKSGNGSFVEPGTMGVPHPDNNPSARHGSLSWTDASNNLFMFGGYGALGLYNDIWRFDRATNNWTWLKGSSDPSYTFNDEASYGTKGVAHVDNTPGTRIPAALWKDNSGQIWMFGGGLNAAINDLWKYDPGSNQWTWVSGDDVTGMDGVYGSVGVTDPANKPGARMYSASWTDNQGNLWLFGGQNGTYFNDLWKFDVTNGQWTWMNGSNSPNTQSVSGTLGMPASANTPGARSDATYWKDAYGRFWLFGGRGYDSDAGAGYLNDMWMYDPSVNQWTKVKQQNGVNRYGVYGVKGTANIANEPGSRFGAAGWVDGVGDVWIYGGQGLAENGVARLADLWKLNSPALSPLPLTFLEFNGRLVNADGWLTWKTENEENVSAFIVERSTDGRNYFPAGTVSANNMSGRQQYQFIDQGITSLGSSVVYYRLKQNDFDGKESYSRIIALSIDRQSLVMLYPNPVTTQASVTITIDRGELVNARIIASAGAVVKQVRWSVPEGSSSFSIDVSSLPAGVYLLDLKGVNLSKTIRFIKQK